MVQNFHFHTVSDLIDKASTVPAKWHTGGHDTPLGYREVLDRMRTGDRQHVEPALKLIETITTSADYDATRSTWVPSVEGAYPSIPDCLAGIPTCMRRVTRVKSEGVPIGLWVAVSSSAGVSLQALRKRGVAVLALAMHLQRFRPVQLHILVCSENQGNVCLDLETAPFDVSVASDFLCNGETARLPMYAILRQATNDYLEAINVSEATIRQTWNIPNGDLVLHGTHLSQTDIINNPVEWINRTAAKVCQR